jgi:hypothetical protein
VEERARTPTGELLSCPGSRSGDEPSVGHVPQLQARNRWSSGLLAKKRETRREKRKLLSINKKKKKKKKKKKLARHQSYLGKIYTTPTASTEENLFGCGVMMPWNLGSGIDIFGAEGETFTAKTMCKDGARTGSLEATLLDCGLSEKSFELLGGELCGDRIGWGCWG